jgi:predicted O-methyltransferase YrrM
MNINQIKEYILSQGSDSLYHFGGAYEGGIHLQQDPDEISEILNFILNKKEIDSMLEIGSAAGANAKVFYEILKLNELFIIDDNQHGKHLFRKENLKDKNYKEYIGNSQTIEAVNWLSSFQKKFDIIYVDGDHSYEGVKKDVENYLQFLKDDGFIIFHDTAACEGVIRLISELEKFNLVEVFSSKLRMGISIYKKL